MAVPAEFEAYADAVDDAIDLLAELEPLLADLNEAEAGYPTGLKVEARAAMAEAYTAAVAAADAANALYDAAEAAVDV